MKGFIASIVTLCLLIGGITWNGIWIHKTLDRFMSEIEIISDAEKTERKALTKELRKKWEECKPILSITVSHTEIESIDSKIVSMESHAENDSNHDFESSLALLREDLEFLHDSESFTLEGII